MTSISSIGSSASLSPLGGVQKLLQRAVSTGAVSSADQTALTSAIGDIGSSLASGSTAQGGSMQDKVNGLVDNEVSNGKLTSDQATELKGLFAKAHAHMHHVHAASGTSAVDSLFATDTTSSTDSTSGTASTDAVTSLASGASGLVDGLASFVNGVRSAVQSNGLYGAGGSTGGQVGTLLVNALA